MSRTALCLQFQERLKEAALYKDQGLDEWAVDLLQVLLRDVETGSLFPEERVQLRSEVRELLRSMNVEPEEVPEWREPPEDASLPSLDEPLELEVEEEADLPVPSVEAPADIGVPDLDAGSELVLDDSAVFDVETGDDAASDDAGIENVPSLPEIEEPAPPRPAAVPEQAAPSIRDLSHSFDYGRALMDGQFWDEALDEFKRSAAVGHRATECWELCGDCAMRLERWEEAIQYYQIIYADPEIPEAAKRQILLKITKCSQTQRRIEVESLKHVREEEGGPVDVSPEVVESLIDKHEFITNTIDSLARYAVSRLIGQTIRSWVDEDGSTVTGSERRYRVLNLLHVGMSSVVLELECLDTGEKLAGQSVTAALDVPVPGKVLARWVHSERMSNSYNLARVYDLASAEEHLFVVREHLPLSLTDLIVPGKAMPIPLAIYLAHQVLEGLGDLHLHMGRDEQIRTTYHLDLRPSRVILDDEKPMVRVYNGGLWKELEHCCRAETQLKKLPLPFLAYRAPEQFRPYLARRRPPVFTDIYLFGAVFYEMLTGHPAFRASSYEEYEIQHCEQYPSPPRVWRPEIPDEVNSLIMRCLESDPMKRWRSATEIALILEKCLDPGSNPARNGSYRAYLEEMRLVS